MPQSDRCPTCGEAAWAHANADDGMTCRPESCPFAGECYGQEDCEQHAVDWRARALRAERFAAVWKESARSNRIGFGWWNACHDKNWTDESDICRTLLTRYGISTYVERSPDAPYGGGYFTSFDDRRKAIFARIDTDLASAYARGVEDAARECDDGTETGEFYATRIRARGTKAKEW